MERYLDDFIQSLSLRRQERVADLLEEARLSKGEIALLTDRLLSFQEFGPLVLTTHREQDPIARADFAGNLGEIYSGFQELFTVSEIISLILNSHSSVLGAEVKALEDELVVLEKLIENYSFLLGEGGAFNFAYLEAFDDDRGRDRFSWEIPDRASQTFSTSEEAVVKSGEGVLSLTENQVTNYSLTASLLDGNATAFIYNDTGIDEAVKLSSSSGWNITIAAANPITSSIAGGEQSSGAQVLAEFRLAEPSPVSEIKFVPHADHPIEILKVVVFPEFESTEGTTLLDSPQLVGGPWTLHFSLMNVAKFHVIINQPVYDRVVSSVSRTESEYRLMLKDAWARPSFTYQTRGINPPIPDRYKWFFQVWRDPRLTAIRYKFARIFAQWGFISLTDFFAHEAWLLQGNDSLGPSNVIPSDMTGNAYSFEYGAYPVVEAELGKEYLDYARPRLKAEPFSTPSISIVPSLPDPSRVALHPFPVPADVWAHDLAIEAELRVIGEAEAILSNPEVWKSGTGWRENYGHGNLELGFWVIFFRYRDNYLLNREWMQRLIDWTFGPGEVFIDVPAVLANPNQLSLRQYGAEGVPAFDYRYNIGLNFVGIGIHTPGSKGVFVSRPLESPSGDIGEVRVKTRETNFRDPQLNRDSNLLTSVEYSVSNVTEPRLESDWIPILPVATDRIEGERFFPDSSGRGFFRFPASRTEVIEVYRNGETIPLDLSLSAIYSKDLQTVIGLNLVGTTYASDDILTCTYHPAQDWTNINFENEGFGDLPLVTAYDQDGAGEGFVSTGGRNTVDLRHFPYIDQAQVDSSSYNTSLGLTPYRPITVILANGTQPINLTNYKREDQTTLPPSGDTHYYIHSGTALIFNNNIDSDFRVYYQFLQNNVRFRTVLRVNSKNFVTPTVDFVHVKAKTRRPDPTRILS